MLFRELLDILMLFRELLDILMLFRELLDIFMHYFISLIKIGARMTENYRQLYSLLHTTKKAKSININKT